MKDFSKRMAKYKPVHDNYYKKKITIRDFIVIFLLTGTFMVLFFSFTVLIIEPNECKNWKEKSEKASYFTLFDWQAQQCARHNIEIDAPVRASKWLETPDICVGSVFFKQKI